jgi:acetylornithine/succinyldiaminopimelate/putrescine aminotransferase
MMVPDPGYFAQVREVCDRQGALLIIDEVQSGLGRTGRLWAIEHFSVAPDIMVIGKGLSGGLYPVTATCFRAELEVVFQRAPFVHISTFGGAEVGCPVALKVLEISSDPGFLAHVGAMADLFADGFKDFRAQHPSTLVGLRQLGLMMGIELADQQLGPLFTKAAYDHGLLAVYANNDPRVVQLLPPLIIEEELVYDILARVEQALGTLERMVAG